MSTLRRALGLIMLIGLGLLISACTLSSETDLIADDVLATPLPATFAMFPFKAEGAEYIRANDAATDYALEGTAYVAGDRSMTIRFVHLDGDSYLMAISGAEPGALYGTIDIRDSILAIKMIFDDNLVAAANTARAEAPPAIASDIVVKDDGIIVSQRDTLDYTIGLLRSGALPSKALVAWVGPDGNAAAPTRIVADGAGFRVAD